MASEREWNETPECPKCQGEGWLWGKELNDPDEATYADTMTRYSCDDPTHGEPTPGNLTEALLRVANVDPTPEPSVTEPPPVSGVDTTVERLEGMRHWMRGTILGKPSLGDPTAYPCHITKGNLATIADTLTLIHELRAGAKTDPLPRADNPPLEPWIPEWILTRSFDVMPPGWIGAHTRDMSDGEIEAEIDDHVAEAVRNTLSLIHTLQAESERLLGLVNLSTEQLEDGNDTLEGLLAERDRLRTGLSALVTSVDSLIMESDGVCGLHLNDDDASWESLTEGGEFEEWLLTLEIARQALTGEPDND